MEWTRKTTKIESLVLCALCIVIPAGAVVAGDGGDPAPEVTPGSPEAAQDADLTLDFVPVLLGAFQDEAKDAPPPSDPTGQQADLAAQATNPVSPLIQMQFQNVFIPESYDADGYANQFIIQPVVPISAKGWFPRSIWRATIPIVTTPDLDAGIDGTTGLGDIVLIGGPVIDYDWGMLVVGPALTLPTATDERLGARQWQLGPLLGPVITKVIPKAQFGALVFQQWGLGGAGDQYTNQLSVQWIFNYHFEDGWYAGWGDQAWIFNWETSEYYIPLSVRGGRVFSIGDQKVNMFLQPFISVGDDVTGQGEWGIKLNLTLLFPQG